MHIDINETSYNVIFTLIFGICVKYVRNIDICRTICNIYIYMITKRIKKLLSIKRRKQFSKYYYITYIIYYLLILIILIPYFIFKYKYCLDFNFHRLKYTKISSRIISVNRSKEFARMNGITNNRNFLTRLL